MGLVPLGPDPASGLWEFAHLLSGEPPARGADGKLMLSEASSIVLVLVPGGTFWMGSQKEDPAGRNFDPHTRTGEFPVHEVELSAFLLSKYELTQAQWLRLTGANPSYFSNSKHAPTLLHPVERVHWHECKRALERVGLGLPSDAQWEYAARAGTSTIWWPGSDQEALRAQHAANLADQSASRLGATWPSIGEWPDLDDGYGAHAPIGTYAANAFGLCEVVGNLWEWCLDGSDELFYFHSPRLDPLAPWEGALTRVVRGGGFDSSARAARSAYRAHYGPTIADDALGVRPARTLALH
jgi:formylglycine-generating enzyme required for sulfatase activity